jgi:hypothetical protein
MTLMHIPDRFAKDSDEWQAFMSAEEFIWAIAKFSHCQACFINALNGYCDEWKQSKEIAAKYANKYLSPEHQVIVKPCIEQPSGKKGFEIVPKALFGDTNA